MFIKDKLYIISIYLFIFLFVSCTQKYKINYEKIDEFKKQGYDSVNIKDIDFKNTIDSSQEYISKFEITDDENTMIGFWEDASWLLIPYNHQSYKIGIYSFLPNKKFLKSSYIDDETIKFFYGNWRVLEQRLEIENISSFIYKNNKIINYTKFNELKYKNLFMIQNYDKYPINTKAFVGEKVPRYRQFHDFVNYGPNIYSPKTQSGNILFNPSNSEEYISELLSLKHFYFY